MKNKREQIADLLIWWALVGSVVEEDTDERADLIFCAWNWLYRDDEGGTKADCELLARAHPLYVTKILPLALARQDMICDQPLTIDEALKGLQDMLEIT
jgi:hypothetical protein